MTRAAGDPARSAHAPVRSGHRWLGEARDVRRHRLTWGASGGSVALILSLLIAALLVLGGGGSAAPGSELACELLSAAACVAWLLLCRPLPPIAGAVRVAPALLLVLKLLQLVPLPPALWQALPGRDTERAALALVGEGATWRPLSVSPARTLASVLALVPPALVLVLASTLSPRGRARVLAIVALGGFASVALGALQLADGAGRAWRFYPDNPGFLNGFQANRNAEADVLLIASLAWVAAARGWCRLREMAPSVTLAATVAGMVPLLLGVVLTGSRAGTALIPLVVASSLIGSRRPVVLAAVLALAAAVFAALSLARIGALDAVAARFTGEPDFRAELWRDTSTAIAAYWPAGSGVGTFKPVFVAFERLVVIDPTWPVRAHNDYLEFLLEGGAAAGVVLLAAAAGLVGLLVRDLRRSSEEARATAVFCLGTVLVLALHSIVDYPLRSMALAALGAIAVGMAAQPAQAGGPRE